MAGAEHLLRILPDRFGPDVRVVRAPCMGACDRAPVCTVGHSQVMHASIESVMAAVAHGTHVTAYPTPNDFDHHAQAATRCSRPVCRGAHARRRHQDGERRRPARPGGAGFPTGRKWSLVRAEPAPRLMAVNADEGEPAPSRTATISSAIPTASSKAC